jgi:hypothetical protein
LEIYLVSDYDDQVTLQYCIGDDDQCIYQHSYAYKDIKQCAGDLLEMKPYLKMTDFEASEKLKGWGGNELSTVGELKPTYGRHSLWWTIEDLRNNGDQLSKWKAFHQLARLLNEAQPKTRESLHTPGPWTWNIGRTLANIKGPLGEQIAQVLYADRSAGRDNARLIAESPELLKIVQQLITWEADPDRYAGDLADLAHTAQAILDRIEQD